LPCICKKLPQAGPADALVITGETKQ